MPLVFYRLFLLIIQECYCEHKGKLDILYVYVSFVREFFNNKGGFTK